MMYDILKAEVFTFTDYDRVVIVDTDTILTRNIDEVFDDDGIIFTRDAYLGGGCWNSGFMVVTPNMEYYNELREIYLTFDYGISSRGWQHTNIGFCYAGGEPQGLFPAVILNHIHPC